MDKKKNVIIIDIGINRLNDGSISGDFYVYEKFNTPKLITSVPGGIGPLTIASLLQNTFNSYLKNL